MRKLNYFALSLILLSALSMNLHAQSIFGFGAPKKGTAPQGQSAPGARPVLNQDQFKKQVNVMHEQTQQGLRDQLKQDLAKRSLKNVSPPANTSTGPSSTNVRPTPPGAPQTPPPAPVVRTNPQAPTQLPALPPTSITQPSAGNGKSQDIYTGYQAPQQQQNNQSNTGGGWNIKY